MTARDAAHAALDTTVEGIATDATTAAELSVTVNVAAVVPLSPSVTVTSWIDTSGTPSSLRIVPMAVPSLISTFRFEPRVTINVSFDSGVVSPLMVTLTVAVVEPAANTTGAPVNAT